MIAQRTAMPRHCFRARSMVERLIRFMGNVLVIEVFARSTFVWAEEVLSDPEVSDGPEEARPGASYPR